MFPRVIALFLSLLGATPLLAQEADGFAPRFVSSIPLFEDDSAQPPKVFEIREQHVRVPTVDLTVETDDGRPILFTGHPRLGGVYSVLGSKIDNIEDVLERLGSTALPAEDRWTR